MFIVLCNMFVSYENMFVRLCNMFVISQRVCQFVQTLVKQDFGTCVDMLM